MVEGEGRNAFSAPSRPPSPGTAHLRTISSQEQQEQECEPATASASKPTPLPTSQPQPTAPAPDPAPAARKLVGMSELDAFVSKEPSGHVRTEYIEFGGAEDKENPFNWPKWRRWFHCVLAMSYTCMTAINATAYSAAEEGVMADFGTSHEIFVLGNALYFIFIAFTPLLLAPLSEVYGRNRILIVSAAAYAILYIPQAVAKNMATILVTRGIQGAVASVGNSLVGGIISDMFAAEERGPLMGFYGLVNFFGQGIGPAPSAYLAASRGWPWVFWWQLILTGAVVILLILFVRESRGSVLLARRAERMTKESFRAAAEAKAARATVSPTATTSALTHASDEEEEASSSPSSAAPDTQEAADIERAARTASNTATRAQPTIYKCRAAEERASLVVMAKTSLTRPIVYLFTEPVIFWMALWAAVAWGTVFLLVDVVPIVFSVYDWTTEQRSLIFLSYALSGVLGLVSNFHQEHLYARSARRYNGKAPPEARLYYPCVSAVLFPIGFFIMGWGARSSVHPAVPIFGICVISFGIYPLYVAVFAFLADSYERYASSALAAQSMLRNLAAGLIPLVASQLYEALGVPWASTLVGCIAAVLGVCPFVLFRYGEQIRGRSRVARAMRAEAERERERAEREKEGHEAKLERARERWAAATATADSERTAAAA
ncbi:hypothetical protein OC834_002265 [Tilletia horrida]|nr:hypothetical protein OC834_002265 [Tilletia horrida]